MVHEYMLYVAFVASKTDLRHPKRDALKNVPTSTVSENYEILLANYGDTMEWRSSRGSARTRCGPPIPSCLGMEVRGLVV